MELGIHRLITQEVPFLLFWENMKSYSNRYGRMGPRNL